MFTTVYMGTVNSSQETQQRAQRLAAQIGADHLDVKIDSVVEAMARLFATITGFTPRFRVRMSFSLPDPWDVRIDSVVDVMAQLFATITGFTPRFRVRTGCWRADAHLREDDDGGPWRCRASRPGYLK